MPIRLIYLDARNPKAVMRRALITLLCIINSAFGYFPSSFSIQGEEPESIEEYRKRNNITFFYDARHINPQYCRYMTEEQCRREDEIASRAKEWKQKRLLNNGIGTFKALVLLVRFTDHKDRELPSRDYFQNLCDGQNGSIAAYYKQQSYGQYNIQCDVKDWMDTDNTELFYSQGEEGLLGSEMSQLFFRPVLDALDSTGIDWYQYDADADDFIDALLVIHSGYAAETPGAKDCTNDRDRLYRIHSQGHLGSDYTQSWSNQALTTWVNGYAIASALHGNCGSEPARLGIPAHEWLHTLGTLDLYGASTGSIGGLGSFDIMSNPLGADLNGTFPGSTSPFSKNLTGWLTPIEIVKDGTYTARPSSSYPDVYIIKSKYPDGEYLLIENRQNISFDSTLWGSGLLIYHVDNAKTLQEDVGYPGQSGWPSNNKHYRVALLQADGLYDLERGNNGGDAGDFWTPGMTLGPGNGGTYPNTDTYQSGKVTATGISIGNIQVSGTTLSFSVTGVSSATSPVAAPAATDSTPKPATKPSPSPTKAASQLSTSAPTSKQTPNPSPKPTTQQTSSPTTNPTKQPTSRPTSSSPTRPPSRKPTSKPTTSPTAAPSLAPTTVPSSLPSQNPSFPPSDMPSSTPTTQPSVNAVQQAKDAPTESPKNKDAVELDPGTPVPSDNSTSKVGNHESGSFSRKFSLSIVFVVAISCAFAA